MPMTSADVPDADKPTDKPEPKPEPKSKTAKAALADAAASTDPAVVKLMWDRGTLEANDQPVDAVDAELRKLGFDV